MRFHANTIIQLYQFRDFDTEQFISLYLQEIAPRKEIEDINMYTGDCTFKEINPHTGTKNREKIIAKCAFLQDTIIRRANSKKDDKSFSISSAVLKAVIGKEYKPMLNVLIQMGYIELGDGNYGLEKHFYYDCGAYSKLYHMKDVPIHCWYGKDPAVQKYRLKAASKIAEYQEGVVHTAIDTQYGDSFRKQYLISLNYFHVDDEDSLSRFVEQNGYDKDSSPYYVYYRDIEAKLNDRKDIYSVDRNGRIYHVLCNLSKDVKEYVNIDFSLDCKNSHPLLLNYFVFQSHNIGVSASYNISFFLHDNLLVGKLIATPPTPTLPYIYHNVRNNLRKLLEENNIENDSVAKLTDNELEYIYLTCSGLLWDTINLRHPEFTRKEIKTKFFTEVLYSKTTSTRGKPFAKEFVAEFPTIYRLICRWKQPSKHADISTYLTEHHLYSPKEHAALSIAMMNLEAQVFTDILKRLYSKRWNAVNIHDCIVVPQTGKKNHPLKEQVRQIMQDVFASYGLCPTFD